MFTGLVVAEGTVLEVSKSGSEMDLVVDLQSLDRPVAVGDSVALSGVCCTVTRIDGGAATFHLSDETLRRTWLGAAEVGSRLNLEPALRMGDPLGGHMVQGHVDGVGQVTRPVGAEGGAWGVAVPADLRRYCVEKGSITIDGVSLTIAALVPIGDQGAVEIEIAIIPHTAAVTTIGRMAAGATVNLEVDVLGKYVEQMLAARFG